MTLRGDPSGDVLKSGFEGLPRRLFTLKGCATMRICGTEMNPEEFLGRIWDSSIQLSGRVFHTVLSFEYRVSVRKSATL
jgi:hypothetical protein